MNKILTLTLLPITVAASANCVTDAPEIGDIGPNSELVCKALESRYPGAALAVEGRAIHSPTEVSVMASVDGQPVSLNYELSGYTWRLDQTAARVANVPSP
jgi:hypothetical protein